MADQFYVSSNNPNDAVGGGGCACSEIRDRDAKGPFVVFPAVESSSNISPHVVVCMGCVNSIVRRAKDKTEVLHSGEKGGPAA